MSKPRLQELNDEFAAKSREAQGILNKSDHSVEEVERAQTILNTELPALKSQIETLQSVSGLKANLSDLDQWQNAPVNDLPQPGQARVTGMKAAGTTVIDREGSNSALYQDGEGLLSDKQMKTVLDADYALAVKSWLRAKGDMSRMGASAIKTLSEGMDDDGGVLAPAEMLMRIIERKPTPTRVAGRVTQLTTSRDAMILPRNTYSADDIYSSGVRVSWTGEGGSPSEATGPAFGTFRVNIYTAMLELGLTNDLIEDAAVPIQSYVADKFRETADILKDHMALTGTGVGQPFGMLTRVGASAGNSGIEAVNSGHASQLTADGLIDLSYTIPEQYMENATWLFNRTNTERAIAKLKDSQNRYLFASTRDRDTLANTRPNELLGTSITRSALMPNIAANAFPVLHGDLNGYYQILRIGFTMQVLREIEARSNQTVLLGRLRMGGDVGEGFRLRAQKVAA